MIELLTGLAALFAILLIVAVVYAVSYRSERDEALQDLTFARGDITSLTNRVTVLRGDNIAQQASIDMLREGHDALVSERDDLKREKGKTEAELTRLGTENTELQREAGRYAAELRAANQKIAKYDRPRGNRGRFAKATADKTKPIACG